MKQQTLRPSPRCFPIIKGFLLGLLLLWLAGCTSAANFMSYGDGVPRRMEADYGRSVTNNKLEMMVNAPDAVDPRPAVGMPGQAAQNVQDRYDKSFKEKEEPPSLRVLIK